MERKFVETLKFNAVVSGLSRCCDKLGLLKIDVAYMVLCFAHLVFQMCHSWLCSQKDLGVWSIFWW